MMKRILVLLVAGAAAGLSLAAYADCAYRGQTYATGSRVNGLTCQSDGNWR